MSKSIKLFSNELYNTQSGPHLSAYIPSNSMSSTTADINSIIKEADSLLSPLLDESERQSFFAPLQSLKSNNKRLKHFTGSIGIFRTPSSFRVINIPVKTERICVVANSFHIKPLIKWTQFDSKYYIFGVNRDGISLYKGSLYHLNHIESISFMEFVRQVKFPIISPTGKIFPEAMKGLLDSIDFIETWLTQHTERESNPIFMIGDSEVTQFITKAIAHPRMRSELIGTKFYKEDINFSAVEVRQILRREARKRLEQGIIEYYNAEDMGQTLESIVQIAKNAVRGKIKKLYIAEDLLVWGKLNPANGKINLHGRQLNHEDDDILDDIAEMVLKKGGEVIVSPMTELPKLKPISAILVPVKKNTLQRKYNSLPKPQTESSQSLDEKASNWDH